MTFNMYGDVADPNGSVSNLITTENIRIEQKEKLINPLYDTQKRKELLAKSSTARNKEIHKMFLILLVVGIISAALMYANSVYAVFPSIVVEMLIIAGIGGASAYIIYMYVEMQKRDKLDFNKVDFSSLLNPPTPDQDSVGNITSTNPKNQTTATGNVVQCTGKDCCPPNSYFVNNICSVKESFTSNHFEPFTPLFKSR